MASAGYWKVLATRRNRRAFLGSAAVAGASATVLAACGGGGDGSNAAKEDKVSPLIAKREDTTGKAVPGGTYGSLFTSEPATQRSVIPNIAGRVYSRLLQYKTGHLDVAPGELVGDLAETWEIAGDGLSITFKLRGDAKWDSRAPTNSRTLTAEDVAYTWKRFEQLDANRSDLANSVSPSAPIQTMTAIDPRTVQVKLAFPSSIAVGYMATHARFYILPMEADGKFNPDNEARGSGPWIVANYRPSAAVEFAKNPNWYRKDRPFLDGWNAPIIPEYAQQLAQFRAGTIWGGVVRQEDILATKSDIPKLSLLRDDEFYYGNSFVHFGFAGDSPYKDERVRRALSMTIDRDTYGSVFNNVEAFEAQGLKREGRWASHVGAGWDGIRLDPKTNALGEGAKYFQFDLAESRKLLDAAGYSGKKISSTAIYGGTLAERNVQALVGMINEGGFDLKLALANTITNGAGYTPIIRSGGNFEGVGFYTLGPVAGVAQIIYSAYHRLGAWNIANPSLSESGDTRLNGMIDQLVKEMDSAKQASQAKDIQKYLALSMAPVPVYVSYQPFSLSWPWVGNLGVFRWDQRTLYNTADGEIHYWYDKSQL
jgi:peptide/nickel transport system substrate-binding protein